MELIFLLKNVTYDLGDKGPRDVWVAVGTDELERLSTDPHADLYDYLMDVANEAWEAAFNGYDHYELIVSQAKIDALPREYDFELERRNQAPHVSQRRSADARRYDPIG